jgi:gentisate 1,2-dioxygenase
MRLSLPFVEDNLLLREKTIMDTAVAPSPAFQSARTLDELYILLDQVQMKNGWNKPTPSLYPTPKPLLIPAHWRYRDAHAALHRAGDLVDAKWAERRNLILANPVPGNDYATVTTLVSAYQMVMPGETARSHRHTPNAMRIVVDTAPNAYTIVDGVNVPMEPGDVLLTPNWSYHGHNNQSDAEAYWIDVLDVPLVQLLGPMFFEHHPELLESASGVDARSPMRFAYSEYRPRLLASAQTSDGVRTLNLGPPEMRSFDRTAIHLAQGAQWLRPKSTVSRIYAVIEGKGRCASGNRTFDWVRGDVIAMPSWHAHTLTGMDDAVLLQSSDLPLLTLLDWVREGHAPTHGGAIGL